MERIVNVPEERAGIVKSSVPRLRKICSSVSLEGNCVVVDGDAIEVMAAENIIRAIGRGFPPEEAFRLQDEDFVLVVIQLPRESKVLQRTRSRLIGRQGKCRENLERLTKTKIRIYGRTVSIIGEYENSGKAREAIEKLIKGASHKNVYTFLERKKSRRLIR